MTGPEIVQFGKAKLVVGGRMLKQKAGIKKAVDVLLKGCGAAITLDDFENNEKNHD